MPRVLNEKALEWLEWMPPYYADDPFVQGVLNALGAEYQRIEDAVNSLITQPKDLPEVTPHLDPTVNGAFPHKANDSLKLLSLWELQLGLPVQPEGMTEDQRRSSVIAHIRRRRAHSERSWAETLTEMLRTTLWSYTTNNGTITITMPYGASNLTGAQVVALAREITPAHLALAFTYDEGFLFDVSTFDTGAF